MLPHAETRGSSEVRTMDPHAETRELLFTHAGATSASHATTQGAGASLEANLAKTERGP